MAIFFSGWLGYGLVVQAGILTEPIDPSYARRPFVLRDVDNGIVRNIGGGTVGPATAAWGRIGFMALFDAQAGGNMLLWLPLPVPLVVGTGNTITMAGGSSSFLFSDIQAGRNATFTWPAGSVVARTPDGRVLTAGVPLQSTGGLLSAQVLTFGSTVTMAALPLAQPASGTSQLWNNGGVISIS
ncbi:hypothetical protein HN018_10845 [Lichenicola cladoniae]|uniref:Uncharacterized protein n=1 Tax=Lichenicola cladoniae TaxID=1484109 RepID=A0A6M8HQB7_9PROT|nr:hypothetical protein [Lichenicola cladoniae]NPD67864.1 hypothetical protein [Acetobacteraceae bacterium]QKE90465.1 hypothetical protein HN018_10845 [Lichenicola cladoniae]